MHELPPLLQANTAKLGFTSLTDIQKECLAAVPIGKDVVARSPTGTGKTAAFLLPLLARMLKEPVLKLIVIEPSRELAIQCANECRKLTLETDIRVVAAYGGTDSARQEELIQAGARILIGTPGRLGEFLQKGVLKPSEYRVLVLDEADRLLSQQFRKETLHLLSRLPRERQLLLFSVQMPAYSLAVIQKELRPGFLTLKTGTVAGSTVTHDFVVTEEKTRALAKLLAHEKDGKSLVFCNSAEGVKELKAGLAYHGIRTHIMHSQLRSDERQKITAAFAQAKTGVLVATDLAARGVHVPNITHVYSFDIPENAEWYVHRAGRTGRMGAAGICTSIILPQEKKELQKALAACGVAAEQRSLSAKEK